MSDNKISEEQRAAARRLGEALRIRRRQSVLQGIIEDIDEELEYRRKQGVGEAGPREECPIPELEPWLYRDYPEASLKDYRLELLERLAKLSG